MLSKKEFLNFIFLFIPSTIYGYCTVNHISSYIETSSFLLFKIPH